jgi:hypothetical protein
LSANNLPKTSQGKDLVALSHSIRQKKDATAILYGNFTATVEIFYKRALLIFKAVTLKAAAVSIASSSPVMENQPAATSHRFTDAGKA